MIMKKFDSLPTNASEKWTFIIYRPGGEWRGGGHCHVVQIGFFEV